MSFHSIRSISAPGPLTLGSSGLYLPLSPELIGVSGYDDIFERHIGHIPLLVTVYSRATDIREIRKEVKQIFIRCKRQWEMGRLTSK